MSQTCTLWVSVVGFQKLKSQSTPKGRLVTMVTLAESAENPARV
jgi:hypothetical protein